jgi:hypothetical protein
MLTKGVYAIGSGSCIRSWLWMSSRPPAVTDATSVACGAETAYPTGAPESTPDF